MRADTLARLRWHQGRGDRTVLVSASLGQYLRPLGRRLGGRVVPAKAGRSFAGRAFGRRERHLAAGVKAVETFLAGEWTISATSDRMGYRLDGPQISHLHGHNIVSDGTVDGSIQVPGSGQPIVLMADAQTTGGNPGKDQAEDRQDDVDDYRDVARQHVAQRVRHALVGDVREVHARHEPEELEREHGFEALWDNRLTAAVNVSRNAEDNYLAQIDDDDVDVDEGGDYRTLYASYQPDVDR